MKPLLLVQTERNHVIERQHFGFIKLINFEGKIISQIGEDFDTPIFLRSAAKPFQAAILIKSGAYKKFKLTKEELAVCSASHTGTKTHTDLVLSVLNKIGLTEKNLLCGIHSPLDTETKNYLIKNSIEPSEIHNNCSGKHAAMLAVCVANNWNIENYTDFEHPLQKEITAFISDFCKIPQKEIIMGIDGCSAPVHALPLKNIGSGFLNLFLDEKYSDLKETFKKFPSLIGGKNRLDTEIIQSSSGKLISKNGAEGLSITINPEKKLALVVKIIDGDMSARAIAVKEALNQLQWLENKPDNNIYSCNSLPVGKIKTLFEL